MEEYTKEQLQKIKDTYERDKRIHGCGYWSVCLEHNCFCSDDAPVRQGFDIDTWEWMEIDMNSGLSVILPGEDVMYDYGDDDDDEFDSSTCWNITNSSYEIGDCIYSIIEKYQRKYGVKGRVPLFIWDRPGECEGMIIYIGCRDTAMMEDVVKEIDNELCERFEFSAESISFVNGPQEYRRGYSIIQEGAPIDIFHAVGYVPCMGGFYTLCWNKDTNSNDSMQVFAKKMNQNGVGIGCWHYEEFEAAYKTVYGMTPSEYHFRQRDPGRFAN